MSFEPASGRAAVHFSPWFATTVRYGPCETAVLGVGFSMLYLVSSSVSVSRLVLVGVAPGVEWAQG